METCLCDLPATQVLCRLQGAVLEHSSAGLEKANSPSNGGPGSAPSRQGWVSWPDQGFLKPQGVNRVRSPVSP